MKPTELTLRRAAPGDAAAIVAALRRAQGASHFARWMYQPELVTQALRSDHLKSWVAIDADGEVRAHGALVNGNATREPDSVRVGGHVLEYGLAFTDPDFRGRGLAVQLGGLALQWARAHHAGEIYSWTTTLRPFAQRALRDAGAVEICLLLAMMPSGINRGYRHDIDQPAAAMLFVLPVGAPRRSLTWQVPADAQPLTAQLTAHLGVTVEVIAPAAATAVTPAPTDAAGLRSYYFSPLRFGVIDLSAASEATLPRVMRRTLAHAQAGANATYLDLSPEHPHAVALLPALVRHGFTYAGVHPDYETGELRLRLQAVTGELQPKSTITTASERGRELLDQVWEGLPRVD